MPTPLEPIVRFFQTPQTSPAQLALAPNERNNSNAPVVLFVGKTSGVGSLRLFHGSYQSTTTFYMDEAIVEKP